MMAMPSGNERDWYKFLSPLLRDAGASRSRCPRATCSRTSPTQRYADGVGAVLEEMDRFGVAQRLIGVAFEHEPASMP